MPNFPIMRTFYDPILSKRMTINFRHGAVLHIVADHMRGKKYKPCTEGPCWKEWLPMLYTTLQTAEDVATLGLLAEAIFDKANDSFNRPIILSYDAYAERNPIPVRIAILENGAVVVIKYWNVATCYFRHEFVPATAHSRFSSVAMHYLRSYGKGKLPLPERSKEVRHPGTRKTETRNDIKFASLENWGFDTKQPRVSATLHSGRIPDWGIDPGQGNMRASPRPLRGRPR